MAAWYDGFALSLGTKVWDSMQPWLKEKGDEYLPEVIALLEKKADETVDKYLPIVMEKLIALLPTVVSAAVKVAVEKAFEMIPNLPNVVLPDVADMATDVVEKILASDPDIPGLSNIIDLSEVLRNLLPHPQGGQQQ